MRKPLLGTGLAAATALALTACGGAEVTEGMPSQIVWSTYGTGTSTYADVAAVADAITSNEGTNVRVITSDTAVGRLTPLREEQAQLARTGDEYIFGFEGDYDFATEDWGPQDLRVVWAPVAPHGLMVKDDSGIETFEDLKGKKFPQITANPSVNNKLEAFLAYGGLTWDDVDVVEVGYSDQPGALQNGKIDVLFQQVYGASLYELESAFPVRWLSMDDDSADKVEAVEEIAPSTEIGEFTGAPGLEDGESAKGLLYTVPVVTYADADADEVEAIVAAINDNYDSFKDATATTDAWNLDQAQVVPKEVPFHEGLIAYLEANDAWTEEAAAQQEALLEREEQLDEAWDEFVETEGADGNVHDAWVAYKNDNLES
ncbi:TAXI family TRAP transporter solute-binding subunit [Nocardioides solisilvae]|uniref:TAXI family TRAP transporter solute-binding subunit n=1 Tax=Nocardioides solisilvae TaxID=1542435 RepID=UPI000D742111|nr:TAXI family TRAP transporter solute-binding subunit [Nocardioides solisilvae]